MDFVRATVMYLVAMFIVIVVYIVSSGPFENIIAGIEGSSSLPDVASTGILVRSAFVMAFALAGIVPTAWFLFWIYHREPDWGYRRL